MTTVKVTDIRGKILKHNLSAQDDPTDAVKHWMFPLKVKQFGHQSL